jgi:hypothetical protein
VQTCFSATPQNRELRLAHRATLGILLSFIDPAKKNRPLRWKTVESFLSAADKYQIKGAVEWFEREVQAELLQRCDEEYGLQDPMTCLGLSLRYNLPEVSRFALRDLIKYPIEDIKQHPAVDGQSLLHLFELRAERAGRLIKVAYNIDSYIEYIIKDGDCPVHPDERDFDWAPETIANIVTHPSWSMLMEAFDSNIEDMEDPDCICYGFPLPEKLEEDILKLENELPDLP